MNPAFPKISEQEFGSKCGVKIIVVAGGTYGHINPALSVVSELKKRGLGEIIFVSPNKELKDRLAKDGTRAYFIPSPRFRRDNLFSFVFSVFRLVSAFCACFYLLLKIRPQAVIGFGGYAAFPLVFCACLFRIPAAIHEQNVAFGKANRLLAHFVKKAFVSFGQTKEILRNDKIIVTGNPLRLGLKVIDKKEALRSLGLGEDFTVLVMGGSLGAHQINEKFIAAARQIKNIHFQVIHLTGKNDFERARDFYNTAGIKNRVYSFCEDMSGVFSAADLVISRAGAATISEICLFRLPAILIPYPYAGAHQKDNAKILAKDNKAVMIEDDKLSAEILAGYLEDFTAHAEKLPRMRERYAQRPGIFDAAGNVVDEVLKLIKN